ncbi:SurA N-terminal domain-containing protein [Candidatus Daviesbacteria bacterium]|nr:SurA N-terminal domain-containing protein [Candidatus Daviesbacteria bacterium]
MAKKTQKSDMNPIANLPASLFSFSERIATFKSSKKIYLIILVIGILLLAFYKKDWFVAATINGIPITNLELQSRLNKQFKEQILNQMINEKIILQEASKMGAIPTEAEISAKISELENQVGGKETLDQLLSQQGQTRETLMDQIKLQLAIAKLYENEATVSAEEIDQFIETNSALLTATDSAQQRKEAEDNLKQQKLSQIFNQKFQELRTNAKIQIF